MTMIAFGLDEFKQLIDAAGYSNKKLTSYADINSIFTDTNLSEQPFTEFEYAMFNSNKPIKVDETNADILWSICIYYNIIGDKQKQLEYIQKLLVVDDIRGNFQMGVYGDINLSDDVTPELIESLQKSMTYFTLAANKGHNKSIINLIRCKLFCITNNITPPDKCIDELKQCTELCEHITDKSLYDYEIYVCQGQICLKMMNEYGGEPEPDCTKIYNEYGLAFKYFKEGMLYGNKRCCEIIKMLMMVTSSGEDDPANYDCITHYYMALLRMKPLNEKGIALIHKELSTYASLVNQDIIDSNRDKPFYIELGDGLLLSFDTFELIKADNV